MPIELKTVEEGIAKAMNQEVAKIAAEETEKAIKLAGENIRANSVLEMQHTVCANVIRHMGVECDETQIVVRFKDNPFKR